MTTRVHTPHRDTAWLTRAACAGQDTARWFADDATAEQAKKVCREQCPVRWDCFWWALRQPYDGGYGIAGGTTRNERRKLLAWDRAARNARNKSGPRATRLTQFSDLRGKGYTVAQAGAAMGVHERTAQRYENTRKSTADTPPSQRGAA